MDGIKNLQLNKSFFLHPSLHFLAECDPITIALFPLQEGIILLYCFL